MAIDGGRRGQRSSALIALLVATLVSAIACTPPSVQAPAPSAPASPRTAPTAASTLPAVDFGPRLEAAIADDESGRLDNIESVLVSVAGRPTSEHYRHARTADTHTHVWSVTKSVVSTLVGIAVGEGKIASVDQTVAELLPERRKQMSEGLARVTLRQLLTMSSGLTDEAYFLERAAADNSLPTILGLPVEESRFRYSNVSSHLVAAIVAERVGMSLLSYARARLFTPLGIDTSAAYTGEETVLRPSQAFADAGFAWATTSDGFHHGCCMLKLTGRDMLKIGQLHLQDGRWNGRRLLPAGWVAKATAPSEGNPDYGLMWWRQSPAGRDAYAALGAFGQMIVVLPALSAVITVSSRRAGDSSVDHSALLTMIEQVIIPEID